MKKLIASSFLALACLVSAQAQIHTLTQTAMSAAINNNVQTFQVASATGITVTPPTMLSIDREAMLVLALNGTFVTVARGQNATAALPHVSGAVVFAGSPDWFYSGSPSGSCTTASTLVTPYVNILTGQQWLCSTLSLGWAPGWQNTSFPPNVTAAVASAAGVVVPSGPLFHITGALAITGFTLPLGFSSGSFTVIPDGAFTTTTATNVAIASTAVVGKALVFTYDQVAGKFYPSY